MAISVIASIYDEALDYLASKATPQDILPYKASKVDLIKTLVTT